MHLAYVVDRRALLLLWNTVCKMACRGRSLIIAPAVDCLWNCLAGWDR